MTDEKKKLIEFYYGLGGYLVPERNKMPTVKSWNTKKIPKQEFISKYGDANLNWGFVIPNGVCIIDVEAHKGGLEQVKRLKESTGVDILKTFHTITGRGGIHAYYKIPENKVAYSGYLKDYNAIEILGAGKKATVPPSIHDNLKPYKVGKLKPCDTAIKNIPTKSKNIFWEPVEKKKQKNKADINPELKDTMEIMTDLLAYIPSTHFNTYDKWVKILFACYDMSKGQKEGFDIFLAWCLTDPAYDGATAKIKKMWEKVKRIYRGTEEDDSENALITQNTLYYTAMKYGAKIKRNLDKLINESINTHFRFMSVEETGAELVRYIRKLGSPLKDSGQKSIGGFKWSYATKGVKNVIYDLIHTQTGIFKKPYTDMKIDAALMKNQIAMYDHAYNLLQKRYGFECKKLEDAKNIKDLYFNHIKHTDKKYAETNYIHFVMHLVSVVRMQLQEFDHTYKSQSQTCLVLFSDKQGIGKSTFARSLSVYPDLVYPINLNKTEDSESRLALCRACMALVDDYNPRSQKELDRLKDLISMNVVMARKKYEVIEQPVRRRASFCLTTNTSQILNDVSGSRRWIVLNVQSINMSVLDELMPKVHAEALSLARNGFKHYASDKELEERENLNDSFSGFAKLDEILTSHYQINIDAEEGLWLSRTEIMGDVNDRYGRNTILDPSVLGRTITRIFAGVRSKRVGAGGKSRIYNLRLVKGFRGNKVQHMIPEGADSFTIQS
jgi:hypothetical protein